MHSKELVLGIAVVLSAFTLVISGWGLGDTEKSAMLVEPWARWPVCREITGDQTFATCELQNQRLDIKLIGHVFLARFWSIPNFGSPSRLAQSLKTFALSGLNMVRGPYGDGAEAQWCG